MNLTNSQGALQGWARGFFFVRTARVSSAGRVRMDSWFSCARMEGKVSITSVVGLIAGFILWDLQH